MRDFHFAVNSPHLVDSFDFRGKPSMNTQYFPLDQSSKRQIIKCIIKIFPRSRTSVFLDNFIIESIDSRNLSTLMISSQQKDVFGIFYLIAK